MIKQLINNQGASFISDKRFTNILLDMGCFTNFPKGKNILKTINETDYANRILAYMDGYEPKDEIFNTMFDELYTQYNYAKNDISYCIQCILYGLNALDGIEKYSTKLDYSWLDQLEEYCNVSQEEVDAWNTEYCILHISPTDADVFVDGRRIKHDDEPIVMELTCGEHKIKVSSTMYYSYEDSFSVSDSQDNSLSIDLKPQFGSILIMTNAKNAMVFIDDRELGIAPISMEKLASGTHTLRIEDVLHKNYEEVFIMKDGERVEKDIKMEPNFGDIVLYTDDKELQVYIDGHYNGKGSWKGQLPVGQHSIECKKESHFTKTLDIFVRLGNESVNTFTLPALEAYYGCLKVNVKPVGSTILLDNKIIGKSPLIYRQALVGNHKLLVYNDLSDKKVEKDIKIEEGIITIVEETLPQTFLNDYRKIQIGDYFYSDGTFTHEKNYSKKIIGIVFTLDTSENEKSRGWSHGKIIAVDNCESGVNVSHEQANEYASNYRKQFVGLYYSNWYLPSIQEWNTILKNLIDVEIPGELISNSKHKLKQLLNIPSEYNSYFWASKNSKEFCILQIQSYLNKVNVNTSNQIYHDIAKVRAIAAF